MQAGYFCSVCDCVLRDSQSYLDHINGKYHNRALGMSMNVERSTTEQVRSPPACSLLCMTLYLNCVLVAWKTSPRPAGRVLPAGEVSAGGSEED